MVDTAAPVTPTARDLLKERDYLLYWASRWSGSFASQIQSVALGWQMYALARRTMSVDQSAFMVGMIGLAAFAPVFLLTLPAGDAADRHDRKTVMLLALAGEFATAVVLTLAAWRGVTTPALLLGVSALFGACRAFFNPANSALGAMIVPRPLLARAIAWNTLAWQSAAVVGPAASGLLIAISPTCAFMTSLALFAVSMLCVLQIRQTTRPARTTGSRLELAKEGLAYVWREKLVLGAISLDLFAVLLGGATALLPVFARDVLHVGPSGFGLLRSAPAVGGVLVGAWLAVKPIHRHAGVYVLGGVALYGLATCVFALSQALWLSVAAMTVLGGADMLSVYVRETLVPLVTPDAMRGRVSAINSVFIGASNELGEFESGVAARFLGPISAALFGGIGAIVVTGAWAGLFPALRKADRMDGSEP